MSSFSGFINNAIEHYEKHMGFFRKNLIGPSDFMAKLKEQFYDPHKQEINYKRLWDLFRLMHDSDSPRLSNSSSLTSEIYRKLQNEFNRSYPGLFGFFKNLCIRGEYENLNNFLTKVIDLEKYYGLTFSNYKSFYSLYRNYTNRRHDKDDILLFDLIKLNLAKDDPSIYKAMTALKKEGIDARPLCQILSDPDKVNFFSTLIVYLNEGDILTTDNYNLLLSGDNLEELADKIFASNLSPVKKVAALEIIKGTHANYLIGMLYNDGNSPIFDLDKSFDYFQECGDYLPAQKAILPLYILSSFDEEGTLYNPQAFAAAHHTASEIIAKDPNDAEARAFLEREESYGKSVQIAEQFKTILCQPLKEVLTQPSSPTFFNKIVLSSFFEAKTHGDASDQQAFDKHYGLTVTK